MRASETTLSILICTYNMVREAPRTILSALPPYQKNITSSEYEVIVVDNGSSQPVDPKFFEGLPKPVRSVQYPGRSASPVQALNWAAQQVAKGSWILFCIDGARLFSDGLVAATLKYAALNPNAFIYTLGRHLGPKVHMQSRLEGYNQTQEDELLASIDWYNHPGKLFGVSALAGSSANGFFSTINESNAFAISRTLFEKIGGFDERFISAGGGLANLEIFQRYVTEPAVFPVCLLAEGTFHQYHDGIATSSKVLWDELNREYTGIFGKPYMPPEYQTLFAGPLRKEAQAFYNESLRKLNLLWGSASRER
jgi:glycosyltransferase involved in cell wall biosynthesis